MFYRNKVTDKLFSALALTYCHLFTNQLRGFECIKGVVVDPVPFNVERDLMTPTMKKKRSQMFKHYQVNRKN